ncbi:hypothetical protein DFH08DRAFT_904844, partial [Mycena albidolilacea]
LESTYESISGGNKSLFSLGAAPQTLRAAPLVERHLRQGTRVRGRDPLLCRRGEQQGRSGAVAHHHPRTGRFGRAHPAPEQASTVATPSRPRNPRLRRCERALAQSSFRNSTSVAPDLHAVASLACHATGLPTTTGPWHVSDAMLMPASAASAQSDSLHATARKNEIVVPGAWSSVRSAHACGKAASTSALVDAPAPPPALDTHVQAGEGKGTQTQTQARRAARSARCAL